jgi:hypothetical protein
MAANTEAVTGKIVDDFWPSDGNIAFSLFVSATVAEIYVKSGIDKEQNIYLYIYWTIY